MQRFIDGLDALSEYTGRAVAWLTLAMVLITFGIVALRYGLSLGSIAVQELVIYLHAVMFMLGAAYTLKHDKHVRVDILYARLSPRRQALVDLLGVVLFLLPTCAFITWISLDYVLASWKTLEGSREAGGLDGVFLLKTLIPLAALALLLQGVAMGLRCLIRLRGR